MKAAWAREMEDVVLGAVCYSGLSPETVSLWVPHVSCKAESHVRMVQVSAVGLICLVLPAVLTPLIAWPLRKAGWIQTGDLTLSSIIALLFLPVFKPAA